MHHSDKKCCCSCAKPLTITSGLLFAVIAVLHLLRLILDWSWTCNGEVVPDWPSWLAIIIGAAMAGWNFLACCKKCHCLRPTPVPPPPPRQV